jgi:hypothetical protein
MSRARNLADLLDANGDVASGALDNVPPSNDASALTTGTLPIARIADGDITAAKLGSTLDLSGKTVTLPAGTGGKILQVQQHFSTTKYSASSGSSSSGYAILQKNLTTTAANSSFLVQCITHVRSGTNDYGTNQDSADLHLGIRRTASGSTVAIGGSNYTRTTGGAPYSGKFYSTDVPWLPNGDWTHAGIYDTFTRSHSYIDSPGLSAGTSITYELTAWWEAYIYVNQSANSNNGGVSSMIIMEIAP